MSPGVEFVSEGLNSLSAPDPRLISFTVVLVIRTELGCACRSLALNKLVVNFASDDVSPKLGARKLDPQDPWKVSPASSSGIQSNDTFGLLVPLPRSLYWSCRHEAAICSFRKRGKLKALSKTGMFSSAKPAQT